MEKLDCLEKTSQKLVRSQLEASTVWHLHLYPEFTTNRVQAQKACFGGARSAAKCWLMISICILQFTFFNPSNPNVIFHLYPPRAHCYHFELRLQLRI